VAHETAESSQLIDAVARRSADGPCSFTLLVPAAHGAVDPEHDGIADAEARLTAALPVLSRAAGHEVVGVVGVEEPFAAIRDALSVFGFDEVMISVLRVETSPRARLDLPRRVRALGVPVQAVIGPQSGPAPVAADPGHGRGEPRARPRTTSHSPLAPGRK
jgi:hypothetical protein